MDLSWNHSSQIYVVASCRNDDSDLIALGGEHSVEVLVVGKTACEQIASFHIGTRITALAWASRSVSPTSSDDWFVELAAAGSDFSLVHLTKSANEPENIFHFGGGLSGHHGKITGMSFSEDSAQYVATVSDDKMMMVWDLYPTHPVPGPRSSIGGSPSQRLQPTAYPIAFPHPLTSIDSHPSTTKEFLVADCRGSIYLTDWRSDPENDQNSWHHSSVVELADPHALSDASMGHSTHLSATAAWRRDTADIVGAVYGSKFSLWDISKIYGGKPFASDTSFSQGGHQFRWCYTYPEYFAISTQSPLKGAIIHVYNTGYVHAQPTQFELGARPHFVRDFDFVASRGIPRLAAAVGRCVYIFPIGVES
ncbi:hypothetical protein Moror_14743 [Moniliophthora roreri MCA 2997]|uniref:Uncharacterized protein n=1 Tax=Moniliophthora roreri (strain MCA 2997) TaxID=1381753 RepID=V2X6L2_MONRO|nr:hypothetical protein Moror_14743 [Moniliophthora roreri MCA 2997]KAI3610713.1 hypothetical protein WG66_007242 [Moniliophthora roreri]